MFIDKVKIFVKSGKGGDGCVAFLHEMYRPHGGPSGGDGGDGGNVILRVNPKLHTLLDFYYHKHYKAGNGRNGEGKCKHGKSADDLVVEVPPGTVVLDADVGASHSDKTVESNEHESGNALPLLADLVDGEYIVAKGGKGGRGNARFATPSNQIPQTSEDGKPGEERWIILELRLIADIGLVGLPNAGKSTLISRLTKAHPKIADYPFTTKQPNLGIAELSPEKRLVIADIPGIIEGAHLGKGMGLDFLRHISRTKVLVILLDILDEPQSAYGALLGELAQYDETLLERPRIVALNKIDAADNEVMNRDWEKIFPDEEIFLISAVAGDGLREILWRLAEIVDSQSFPSTGSGNAGHRACRDAEMTDNR